jgi:C_GCAxxG_C_C family probable redox protein
MDNSLIEEAKANAVARFSETGAEHINCAQAVLAFALDLMYLDPALIAVASYFGGGVARTGETCGAITGAAMALGVRDYHLREVDAVLRAQTSNELNQLIRSFSEEFEGVRCFDLTGCDSNTAEGQAAFQAGGNGRCPAFVEWVCDRLAPMVSSAK